MVGLGIIEQLLGGGIGTKTGGAFQGGGGILATIGTPEFTSSILASWVGDNAGKFIKLALGELAKQSILQGLKGGIA